MTKAVRRGVLGFALLACSTMVAAVPSFAASPLKAIGAENEYADVIGQIGGKYVDVGSIISDPNTDPHSFEASPKIAGSIAGAQLIVKNGVGYDAWTDKLMAASPNARRKVIDVQELLGLPKDTPNPHLWYDPKTMPAVAKAIAADLSALEPEHASAFKANLETFDASLKPWFAAIAAFKKDLPNTPVAATEPVSNYMLQAAGCDILSPETLETAIMNGTDPSPQDVSKQNELFTGHKVKVFAYNQQVTSTLTQSFLSLAKTSDIPVVGVYETMPTGFTYQSWMMAEIEAIRKAVTQKVSTVTLEKK